MARSTFAEIVRTGSFHHECWNWIGPDSQPDPEAAHDRAMPPTPNFFNVVGWHADHILVEASYHTDELPDLMRLTERDLAGNCICQVMMYGDEKFIDEEEAAMVLEIMDTDYAMLAGAR